MEKLLSYWLPTGCTSRKVVYFPIDSYFGEDANPPKSPGKQRNNRSLLCLDSQSLLRAQTSKTLEAVELAGLPY